MYLETAFDVLNGLRPDYRRAVFLRLTAGNTPMAKGSWFGPDSGDEDGCCPLIHAVAAIREFTVTQLRQELEGLDVHVIIDRVASYLGLRSVHVSVFVTLWDRSHDADALEMLQRMADECGTVEVDPARAANGHPGNRAFLVEEEAGVLVGV